MSLDLNIAEISAISGAMNDGVVRGNVNRSPLTAVYSNLLLSTNVYAIKRNLNSEDTVLTDLSTQAGCPNSGGGAGGSGTIIVRYETQTRTYNVLTAYANDAAAATGGIRVGQYYRDSASGAARQRIV